MKYTLDQDGYVETALWGCSVAGSAEYTGKVPDGYASLTDWAERACINAYYLEDGNLILDDLREDNLKLLYDQQEIDYSPVLHRDLFETHEIIDAQYKKSTVYGSTLVVTDARSLAPTVRISGLSAEKITLFAQSKNMLPLALKSENRDGLTFEVGNGYVRITGTTTKDVEYTLAGGGTEPIYALLTGNEYRLDTGEISCVMTYYDGETTQIVYEGGDGIITVPENKAVTEIKLVIPSGTVISKYVCPSLSYANTLLTSEEMQGEVKTYTIDLTGYEFTSSAYVLISGGVAALYSGGKAQALRGGNFRLLNGYNLIYTDKKNSVEITYTSNELQVADMAFLQGKSTTTNKFMILEDGSIIATDGYFNGEVRCTKLTVAKGAEVSGIGMSEDEVTQITQKAISTGNVIIGGYIYDKTDSTKQVILGVNDSENLQVGTVSSKASYKKLRLYAPDAIEFYPNGLSADAGYALRVTEAGMRTQKDIELSNCDVVDGNGVKKYYEHGDDIVARQITLQSPVTASVDVVYRSTTSNRLGISSSLRKYKNSIGDVTDKSLNPKRLYDLPVRQFKWNRDVIGTEYDYDEYSIGFIAEEVDEIYPRAAVYRDDELASWSERNLVPAMLQLIQEQHSEIETLKKDVDLLKGGSK